MPGTLVKRTCVTFAAVVASIPTVSPPMRTQAGHNTAIARTPWAPDGGSCPPRTLEPFAWGAVDPKARGSAWSLNDCWPLAQSPVSLRAHHTRATPCSRHLLFCLSGQRRPTQTKCRVCFGLVCFFWFSVFAIFAYKYLASWQLAVMNVTTWM